MVFQSVGQQEELIYVPRGSTANTPVHLSSRKTSSSNICSLSTNFDASSSVVIFFFYDSVLYNENLEVNEKCQFSSSLFLKQSLFNKCIL